MNVGRGGYPFGREPKRWLTRPVSCQTGELEDHFDKEDTDEISHPIRLASFPELLLLPG
jgi:hypothetical protein